MCGKEREIDYFAYGSNLDAGQMEERGVPFSDAERAELPGWKLVFTEYSEPWEGGVADVIPGDEEDVVKGVVYTIDTDGLKNLDHYEGRRLEDGMEVGMYRRQYLPVKVQGDWRTVLTYVVNLSCEYKRENRYPPSKKYIETIVGGAEEHGIDEEYIEGLWESTVEKV